MGRTVATKPAVVKATTAQEKLTVVAVKGLLTFDRIVKKLNSNGKEYLATPHGAVYSKIDEIQTGVIYAVVELSNGAIACNLATSQEKMKFYQEQLELYPHMSVADIKEILGLK